MKQIHHEPCDYYTFGNKLDAERYDHGRLLAAGIRIPRLIAIDPETERIVKEYIEGPHRFRAAPGGPLRGGIPPPGPRNGRAGKGRGPQHRLLPHELRGPKGPALVHRLRVQRLRRSMELRNLGSFPLDADSIGCLRTSCQCLSFGDRRHPACHGNRMPDETASRKPRGPMTVPEKKPVTGPICSSDRSDRF